jgi:hypothetical protein
VNEKNSITQAITKVKALQHKSRNPERSVGAPPTLQRQIPVPVYELSGRAEIPEPAFIPTQEYHSIIPEDHSEAEPSSGNTYLQRSSTDTSVIQTDSVMPIMNPGLSDTALGKRRADDSITDGPSKKARSRTCQKCGQQQCAGAANRKYCKNSCQDCGKMECRGRNSQHPRKTCAVGWGLHHKELKL